MDRALLIMRVCVLLVLTGLFEGCDRNPLKPRVHVNRGSPLTALNSAIFKIRAYAGAYGHLPQANVNLADVGEYSVLPEIAAVLEYGGNDSLSLNSPDRLIVLKCVSPIPLPNGMVGFYCALLSGEVLLLQDKDATVGKVCPVGIGTAVLPKP